MSTLSNPDSVANANQGEFKPSIGPSGPLRTDGHQLGRKVAPADFKPEFHAQTLPPGTAPASSSYQPNPVSEVGGQALNDLMDRSHGKPKTSTSAGQTITGATSADVHRGLGHPGAGETKNEIRHDGSHGRKRQTYGLEGVGAHREEKFERTRAAQRGLEREEAAASGSLGNKGEKGAEDIPPVSAESLAAEWNYEPGTKRGATHGEGSYAGTGPH